ncbi:unnamed protein product [Bemisia tabaci]|uniref:Uncharacterized protein n=1 Tax=Bemisia tabaci TaxID=7038 RepID=A0A9P0AAD9_BEMTA|nr:unnamed protein product [Bemisia tabaci]
MRKQNTQLTYDKFAEWCDGYNEIIFHPFSVVKAISQNKFDLYWGHSGPAVMIKTLIDYSGSGGMLDIHFLLSGRTLKKRIQEDLVYTDLFQHEEFYWGLLASTACVNAVKMDGDTYTYTLEIPNKEVNEYLKYHFQTQLEKEKGEIR